jgi:hypothetical protein
VRADALNIPEKVRIGSMTYPVTQSDKTLIVNGRECKGRIDYNMHTIEINNVVQDLQGCEQTLLHEIVHGIIDDRAISLDGDTEEVVDGLAMGLHQLIKDNPEIFKIS